MHRIGTSDRPDWGFAVVVGAGGMGMAAARRLSQRRRVLLVDIDASRAEAGAEELRRGGGDARAIACDVTDPASIAALARTVADLGGFQVLAHVAALAPATADFDQIIRVNLTGAALVADALRPLAQAGTAAILVSSVAGHNVRPAAAADDLLLGSPTDPALARKLAAVLTPEEVRPGYGYILSKYAVIAYCRRRAAAWGERGARIVSLSPGLIATPMGATTYEKFPDKMRLFERTPLKREGTMLEIADAVEFLASDRASFISGTDLLVDGGLTAAQGND